MDILGKVHQIIFIVDHIVLIVVEQIYMAKEIKLIQYKMINHLVHHRVLQLIAPLHTFILTLFTAL